MPIGVGAGKFLGVRRLFSQISPNLLEKFLCDLCPQILSREDHENPSFGMFSIKKVFMCVLWTLGAIFWNQTTFATIFAQIFRDFARIFDK